MKKYEFVNTLKLDSLKPEDHSFGLIHASSIVQKVDWEQHNEYEILFMEKAYGTFLIGDSIFSCNERSDESLLLFFGKNLPHSFHYDNSIENLPQEVGIFSLLFNENCLGEKFFDLPEMRKSKAFLSSASRGFIIKGGAKDKIGRIIKTLYASEGIVRLQLFLEIIAVLTETNESEQISNNPMTQNEDEYQCERINKIIAYIYRNYKKNITVEDIAKNAYMSPQSFRSFFKKTTGQTLIKFLNQLRISKVCELLMTTDLDITSIAFECGFNNLSNFNRRFRQIKKISPREFRAKNFLTSQIRQL